MASNELINRFAWVERIARDRNVSAPAVRLAVVIALSFGNDKGDIRPSQRKIAEKLSLGSHGVRTVRRLAAELELQRYLKRVVGHGHKRTHYTLTEPTPRPLTLPLMRKVDGGKASAPTGWEANYPRWAAFRALIGDEKWQWFAKARADGDDETRLVASSLFEREKIESLFDGAMRRHFGFDVVVVCEPLAQKGKAA